MKNSRIALAVVLVASGLLIAGAAMFQWTLEQVAIPFIGLALLCAGLWLCIAALRGAYLRGSSIKEECGGFIAGLGMTAVACIILYNLVAGGWDPSGTYYEATTGWLMGLLILQALGSIISDGPRVWNIFMGLYAIAGMGVFARDWHDESWYFTDEQFFWAIISICLLSLGLSLMRKPAASANNRTVRRGIMAACFVLQVVHLYISYVYVSFASQWDVFFGNDIAIVAVLAILGILYMIFKLSRTEKMLRSSLAELTDLTQRMRAEQPQQSNPAEKQSDSEET